MPGEEVIEGKRIPETADLSLVDGPVQLCRRDNRGEVEQGARDGGDGDAGVGCDLIGR
jgi:hypothetical protein